MSELAGILGLVFVVILFNFTYPPRAMELLLKATEYFYSIDSDKVSLSPSNLLKNVKGWFFFTDLLQFLITYFIGIFSVIFMSVYYLPDFLNIVALIVSISCILLYILMLIISIIRIIKFDNKSLFLNRQKWFLGKSDKKPFNSKFPMIVFIIFSVITIFTLIVSIVIGLNSHSFLCFIENTRLQSLGFAIIVVVLGYLLDFWGGYIYMPSSSLGTLCYLSVKNNSESS